MNGLDKFGAIMEILIEDCDGCPLERICESNCDSVWQGFLDSKVKEDGIENGEGI